MNNDFINLTKNNIDNEHLCCIIRTKTINKGVEAKRQWLKKRIEEGHIFRKLNVKGTVFIEYAPLEKAWVPIIGDNYIYIYCLWVSGEYKGLGYGKMLLEYTINEAKKQNKSGICMLGATRQKAWLTDQSFAKKYGFKVVDSTNNEYDLLALSFDNTFPKFSKTAKEENINNQDLTIYYDMQCPFIYQKVSDIKTYCEENNIPLSLNLIDNLEKAKSVPSVFNNFSLFYKGKLVTVNIADIAYIQRLLKK